MTGNLLATFPRTDRTEVRLSVSHFKGRQLIDLRLYFLSTDGTWLPSRKGCAIQPGELPNLLAALERARQEVTP
ncbi:MAG: transcriptional coactivator p15/PC4 family protein [Gammaproteobacteria bacterium]